MIRFVQHSLFSFYVKHQLSNACILESRELCHTHINDSHRILSPKYVYFLRLYMTVYICKYVMVNGINGQHSVGLFLDKISIERNKIPWLITMFLSNRTQTQTYTDRLVISKCWLIAAPRRNDEMRTSMTAIDGCVFRSVPIQAGCQEELLLVSLPAYRLSLTRPCCTSSQQLLSPHRSRSSWITSRHKEPMPAAV